MKEQINKHASLILFIGVIIGWQVIVTVFQISEYLIPAPSAIVHSLIVNRKIMLMHASMTIFEASLGLLLAIAIGLIVAVIFHNYKLVRRLLMPYVSTLQTIPAIVIAPLFALWFGFGLFPKLLLIVIFCSFPIIVTTVHSFDQTDSETIGYLKSLGATKLEMYQHLYIPASLPALFGSIKIATTYALINAIFAEYMGAQVGLGVYLNRAASSFNTTDIFAIIVVIIIVTLGLLKLVELIEHKIIKWS